MRPPFAAARTLPAAGDHDVAAEHQLGAGGGDAENLSADVCWRLFWVSEKVSGIARAVRETA
jgi:hypothetical protein